MARRRFPAALCVLAALLLPCGCRNESEHEPDAEPHEHAEGHHHHEEEPAVPAPYAGMTNPVVLASTDPPDAANLYGEKCGACHGPDGKGDGPAAERLAVKPTDFTVKEHMAEMKDDFLFWRISEGGAMAPFDSKMPAWKEKLSERERWLLVHHLRLLAR